MGKKRRRYTDKWIDDEKSWKRLKEALPSKVYDELWQVLHSPNCNRGMSTPVFCSLYPYEFTRWGSSRYSECRISTPRDILRSIDNNWDGDGVVSLHLCDTQTEGKLLDVIYILKPAISFRFKAWLLHTFNSTLKNIRDEDSRTKLKKEITRIKRVGVKVKKEIRHLDSKEN